MQKLFSQKSGYLILWCLLMISGTSAIGQTVVGIGTENPNPNAVLELFSENFNQGFLVPRLTTAQRIANSFTSQLSTKDNGLLIFDTDEGSFFYWFDGKWHQGSYTGSSPAGAGQWFEGSTPDNNVGNNGDFFFNSVSGDVYRKKNGQYFIIGNIAAAKKVYSEGTGIHIDPSGEISNTGDLDERNEIQNLSSVLAQGADAAGRTLSNLGAPTAPNDAATKAYVDASKTLPEGNILIGSSNSRAQPLNAKAAGNILIGNGTTVASVTISGDLVLLPDGTFTLKDLVVTSTKIADDAITKEKINADVAGNGLGQNADGSLEIKVAGGGLQIASDYLKLSNVGNGQVLIGNGSQVNAQNIAGDISLTSNGQATTVGLQGRTIANVAPANNQVLAWNGTQWMPQSLSSINTSANWYSGTVVPSSSYPTAVDGDFYYKTDTQIIYRKEGLSWVTLGKLVDSNASTPTTYTPGNNSEPLSTLGNIGDFYVKLNGEAYIKTEINRWERFK